MTIHTPLLSVADFEDFITLPEHADKLFEFIAGEIVEVPSNPYSSRIAIRIARYLDTFAEEHGLGFVTGEGCGYQIGEERYAPDVAFVRFARQPSPDKSGYNHLPPDLAVEVVSPTDREKYLTIKVTHYLLAGVTVWVVYPDDQEVHVYAPGQTVQILTAQDTIQGGDVLPGFTLPVHQCFPSE